MSLGEAERRHLKSVNEMGLSIFSSWTLKDLSAVILDQIADVISHDKSMLTWDYSSYDPRSARSALSHTLSSREIECYERDYACHDYTAWYLNMPETGAYRDSDLVPPDRMKQSPIFRGWVQPMGMHHVCGAVFRSHGLRVGDIVLLRREGQGDFSDDELFLLELVIAQVGERFSQIIPYDPDGVMEMLSSLTEREREVALSAGTDLSLREIADRLGISYGTVRKHMAAIYEKLGISSRVQLVHLVVENALGIASECEA